MYFVIRYNWINGELDNKVTTGYFKSLKSARHFCTFSLPYDSQRNTLAIVKLPEGYCQYRLPVEVYDWSDYYECYIPVKMDDIRKRVTMTY